LPNTEDSTSPVGYLNAASIVYAKACGFEVPGIDYQRVVADARRGKRIATAYMAAPSFDPGALPAFRALRDETIRQYAFLTAPIDQDGLGVTVEVCQDDPYTSAMEMISDLRNHRRLKVYATGGPGNEHPFLTNDENDMFRAVHDAFGHAAIGRGFDHHGEEAAWLKHSSMYSPLARQALTTETRGQNCTLIFHYQGRRFAEQKVVLLPEEFSDTRNVSLRDQPGNEYDG
jgi:hypothetical protein